MSLFALLIALLAEQLRPLAAHNAVFAGLHAWSVSVRRALDEGRWPAHERAQAGAEDGLGLTPQSLGGAFVWLAAVAAPVALVAALHAALAWLAWPLALLFDAAVLYAMLGWRQTSGWTHALRQAWAAGEGQRADATLAHWTAAQPIAGGVRDHAHAPHPEVSRAQAQAVLSVHQRVLAPIVWFVLGAILGLGPAGAVLYRMGQMLAVKWAVNNAPVSSASQAATARAWHWLDWPSARATALGFALVGSFEDAMSAWRSQRGRGVDNNAFIQAVAQAAMGAHWQRPHDSQDRLDWAERQLARAHSHVGRIAVVWVVALAALTFSGVPGF